MTETSKNRQTLLVVVTAVVVFFAVRAVFGDAIAGFLDGMVVGFTDAR